MKQTISTRLTVPTASLSEEGGHAYLQSLINTVAEDLKEEHGYTSVEYLDHKLEEGYLDTADADHLSFVVSYEVELR
ncbi:hypothetical protein [Sphingobacterium sp. 1.A.4]|uniref:hypothetical protein n=1 Tax=Sphingobacterium sp. 1.A.4 TaxID=2044603 RepID=UPI000C0C012B|nr:hypothetical protein [Sphingobacterium sp. 1.A.4]